jgi:hypothetical protein
MEQGSCNRGHARPFVMEARVGLARYERRAGNAISRPAIDRSESRSAARPVLHDLCRISVDRRRRVLLVGRDPAGTQRVEREKRPLSFRTRTHTRRTPLRDRNGPVHCHERRHNRADRNATSTPAGTPDPFDQLALRVRLLQIFGDERRSLDVATHRHDAVDAPTCLTARNFGGGGGGDPGRNVSPAAGKK